MERQESWENFILGPLPKLTTTVDGTKDLVDDLILQEPGFASIRDNMPIRHVVWTNRSKNRMMKKDILELMFHYTKLINFLHECNSSMLQL